MTSKYWCRKDFQFRKAVETHHAQPPQVRATLAGRAVSPLDVEVKLCRSWREVPEQMEEAFGCQPHDGMAQTVSRE